MDGVPSFEILRMKKFISYLTKKKIEKKIVINQNIQVLFKKNTQNKKKCILRLCSNSTSVIISSICSSGRYCAIPAIDFQKILGEIFAQCVAKRLRLLNFVRYGCRPVGGVY